MAEQETGVITTEPDKPPSTLFDILLNSREEYKDEIAYIYRAGEREVEVSYSKAVEYYGGVPVLIPTLLENTDFIKDVISKVYM